MVGQRFVMDRAQDQTWGYEHLENFVYSQALLTDSSHPSTTRKHHNPKQCARKGDQTLVLSIYRIQPKQLAHTAILSSPRDTNSWWQKSSQLIFSDCIPPSKLI